MCVRGSQIAMHSAMRWAKVGSARTLPVVIGGASAAFVLLLATAPFVAVERAIAGANEEAVPSATAIATALATQDLTAKLLATWIIERHPSKGRGPAAVPWSSI